MDEQHEELAALNALHALDDSEQSALEIEIARDGDFEKLAQELEQTAAALAAVVPAVKPPAQLKAAIMEQVRDRVAAKKSAAAKPATTPSRFMPIVWGIAASLAIACFWLWNERAQLAQQVISMTEVEAEAREQLITVRDERDRLDEENTETARQLGELKAQFDAMRQNNQHSQQQLAALNQEVSQLRKKDAFAQMQIATLQSSVAAYQQGVAVVVWDSEKHQGVLKLEKMPPVEAGKDYQLWVVDPKNPVPVDAGVVQVDAQGFAKVDFKPVTDVSGATKFALSVEREGGVPKGEGPIILIGP